MRTIADARGEVMYTTDTEIDEVTYGLPMGPVTVADGDIISAGCDGDRRASADEHAARDLGGRKMSSMIQRTTTITIVPEGEPLYSELATTISIEDESGGEFVAVCQDGSTSAGKIQINPEEWPALREAIDRMIGECRETHRD